MCDCRVPQKTNINLNKVDFPDYKSYKKEYDRQYSLLTRERRREIYKNKNEEKKEVAKKYRDDNPKLMKKINEKRNKKYYEDENTRKKSLERGWKRAGIIINENTFNYYNDTKYCESCGIEFIIGKGEGKNKKQLDHDHNSGHIRNVICKSCNIFRRGLDNKKNILHLELHRFFNLK